MSKKPWKTRKSKAGVVLNNGSQTMVFDTATLGYDPDMMHHLIYIHSMGSTGCIPTVQASFDGSNWAVIATLVVNTSTIVRTGDIGDLPYKYVKVVISSDSDDVATVDVESFGTVSELRSE